jgi:hypothetical protein
VKNNHKVEILLQEQEIPHDPGDQVMLQREFLDVRDLDILELEMLHLYLEP